MVNLFAQGCELMCYSFLGLQLQFTVESWQIVEPKLEQQQQRPVELLRGQMVPHRAKFASSNWCFSVSLQWANPALSYVLLKDSSMNTKRALLEVNNHFNYSLIAFLMLLLLLLFSCFLDTDSLLG